MAPWLKTVSCLLLALFAGLLLARSGAAQSGIFRYGQICDASAAIALDADHFVVADDESNILHIYRRGQSDPLGSIDLIEHLHSQGKGESDIEGAAAIGNRIYWIASHGRNKDGDVKEERYRFFATDMMPGFLDPAGESYDGLLDDLLAAEGLAPYGLAEAAEQVPEEEGGLNIEGLAAMPDGKLLIGFRNPLPGGKALVVPLDNPRDVVAGARATFGAPLEVDLGGRGIRSIERVGSDYLILAGPYGDDGTFALFRWSGTADSAPREMSGLDEDDGLHPEALFAIPATAEVQILSDDGDLKIDGRRCKKLDDDSKKAFRSLVLTPG